MARFVKSGRIFYFCDLNIQESVCSVTQNSRSARGGDGTGWVGGGTVVIHCSVTIKS